MDYNYIFGRIEQVLIITVGVTLAIMLLSVIIEAIAKWIMNQQDLVNKISKVVVAIGGYAFYALVGAFILHYLFMFIESLLE